MSLFEYLQEVDYAQGLDLSVSNWKMTIPYDSKEFVPYELLKYRVISEGVRVVENGRLLIPIRG